MTQILTEFFEQQIARLEKRSHLIVGENLLPCDPPIERPRVARTVDAIREELPPLFLNHWSAEPAILPVLLPPGVGKTEAVKQVVREHPERSAVIAVPTIDQRDDVARSTGLSALLSLSADTCEVIARGDRSPLAHQGLGHSVRAAICKRCPHRASCERSGWLGSHQRFRQSLQQPGPIRSVMTTAALAGVARDLLPWRVLSRWKTRDLRAAERAEQHDWHRPLLAIDEDIMPLIAREVRIPRSRLEQYSQVLLAMLDQHGDCVAGMSKGGIRKHLELIRRLLEQMSQPHQPPRENTIFAFSLKDGYAVAVADRGRLSALASSSLAALNGDHRAAIDLLAMKSHPAERLHVRASGRLEPRPIGDWLPFAWAPLCQALIQGVKPTGCSAWIEIHEASEAAIVCKYSPLDLPRLAASVHTLQLDATAESKIWRPLWVSLGKHFQNEPKVLEPVRADVDRRLRLIWAPNVTYSDATKAEAWASYAISIAKHVGPTLGIITRKSAVPIVKKALIAAGLSVVCLKEEDGMVQAERGWGSPASGNKITQSGRLPDVIVGHYVAHHRATNAFQDCSALLLLGTLRPPTSQALMQTGWLMARGIQVEPLPPTSGLTYYGVDAEGCGYKRLNRGIEVEDPVANQVLQTTRAAELQQAIERIRSVNRDADGAPVRVYLVGPEPTIELPFPLAQLVPARDLLDLLPKDADAGPSLADLVEDAIAAGQTSDRKMKVWIRAKGVTFRNIEVERLRQRAMTLREQVSPDLY